MKYFVATILGVLATQASAACSRETLKAVTDELLTAQTMGHTTFGSLSSTVAYSENRKKVDMKSGKRTSMSAPVMVRALTVYLCLGILSKAMKIDHSRAQHDTTECAAFSEFIVTNAKAPYVIATQLRLDNATKVSQIDTIVTTKGDWLFNVTGTYYWASREKWDPIPPEKQDSRATIKAAGDAYSDLFNDKSVKVPWGSPCARLEGGAYTGKGQASDRCDVGVPSGVRLVNRQYVIDEEYGTVDIIMDFGGIAGRPGADGLPDSHEFRVEGGKLRYVHTLSSCGGKACM
jgi:hypothetical protein